MFIIFFNIAIFCVASTGFFPPESTFYSDLVTYDAGDEEYDINNPSKLPTPEDVLDNLYENTFEVEILDIPLTDIDLNYAGLMAGIVIVGIIIARFAHSMIPIALMLVGLMFTLMWANSKDVIDGVVSGLDSSVNYFILMFMIGVLFSFIILIYDTASGQRSTK